MARVDYYDDPTAPTPNSVVPAAVGFVPDEQGRILRIWRPPLFGAFTRLTDAGRRLIGGRQTG